MHRYERLHQKYLNDAEKLLRKKDYPQMSEKLWGATATLVKNIAEKRGWKHHSHRDILVATSRISTELGDPEIRHLFSTAVSLHANFYEDYLKADGASQAVEDIRNLVTKLQAVNGKG